MTSRRGVFFLVVLLLLVGGAGLAWIQRGHGSASPVGPTVLVFDVPTTITESHPASSALSFTDLRGNEATLWDVVFGIRHAARDGRVKALVLHVESVDWGWSRLADLREAIAEFRASGKPVYASLRGGAEAEYLLACSANHLAMPTTATLQLDGLVASAMFLRGTYDKLGITPNFEHVGTYKSAVESYTRTEMSPDARAALESLLDDEFHLLVDSLAAARRLSADSIRACIDDGPYMATDALAHGLIDTLLEQAEVDSFARQAAGASARMVRLERYLDHVDTEDESAPIALVVASGTIMPGRSHSSAWSGDQIGSETLIAQLRDLRERSSVRAVVLRIDSPGGDGGASDDVWREVRRLGARKPVIVSMSDLAASGGYYIACAGDTIVAQPGTLTGSIGVFGGKLNLLGLYRKVGLNIETVTRGRHAEMMSPFRDFTPEESDRFRSRLESFYRVFLSRVSEGRGLTAAYVDSVGQGRVWSGLAARQIGLVDELGGMRRALQIAAKRAGLDADDARRVRMVPRRQESVLRRLVTELGRDEDEPSVLAAFRVPEDLKVWGQVAEYPAGRVLALMPYSVRIR